MEGSLKKWWFWVAVVLVIIIILMLPVWCTTYYLPDQATQAAIEARHCGPILDMLKVY